MSITTDDDGIRKQFEPGCASVQRRLDAVSRICDAGIKVAVCASPMLPMDDPEAFGRRLAKMGVAKIYSNWFHESKRDFVAGTREGAFEIAGQIGWTEREFHVARAALMAGFGAAPAGHPALAAA